VSDELKPAAIPYLAVRGAREAIAWYSDVLGAQLEGDLYEGDDGTIGHATLRIGSGVIYVADEYPPFGVVAPKPNSASVTLMLPVDDTDRVLARAVARGGKADERGVYEAYGSRNAWFFDPFGHRWGLNGPTRSE
jgi:uncharacterized glyoxalase superfamily protein PhnB